MFVQLCFVVFLNLEKSGASWMESQLQHHSTDSRVSGGGGGVPLLVKSTAPHQAPVLLFSGSPGPCALAESLDCDTDPKIPRLPSFYTATASFLLLVPFSPCEVRAE